MSHKNNKDYLVATYEGTTLLGLFLFLSIGVLLNASVGIPPVLFTIAFVLSFVLLVVAFFTHRDSCFAVVFPLFLVSFGGLWSLAPLSDFALSSGGEGVRSSAYHQYVVNIQSAQKATGKHLSCDAIAEAEGKSYKIRLNTDSSIHLSEGQRLKASLRIYMPHNYGGQFNYPLYLYRNGYAGVAWLNRKELMEGQFFSNDYNDHLISPQSLRKTIIARYAKMGVTSGNLPILSAITLGCRPQNDSTQQDFRDAGVAHVLVVSGMHVGFLFLLIMLFYHRWKHWSIIVLGTIILWLYAVLVGLAPSVLRATIMFSTMLLMQFVGGEYKSLNALSLSAVILMMADPMIIYSVSFQMSFLAVLSIILFYPAIPSLKFGRRNILTHLLKTLYDAARLSLSAQILLAPVLLYYFGRFPVYFLVTNVATTLLTPLIFVGGFLTLLPFVGYAISPIINLIITLDCSIVHWVASLPGSTFALHFDLLTTIVCLLPLFALADMLRSTDDDALAA